MTTKSRQFGAIFQTSIGPCALSWEDAHLTRVRLPEGSKTKLEKRVAKECVLIDTPPPWISNTIKAIQKLLDGGAASTTLQDIDLGTSKLPTFHRNIYTVARKIPPGSTVSYAQLAAAARSPLAFRAAGQAMAKNPFPLIVPCHRVLAAGNLPGGFSAVGSVKTKSEILFREGANLALVFQKDPFVSLTKIATRLSAADKKLGTFIQKSKPLTFTLKNEFSIYQYLTKSILYQQLAGAAARTIFNRFLALYPGKPFPTPEDLERSTPEFLRTAGVSASKAKAIHDLAVKALEGTVPTDDEAAFLTDQQLIDRLTQVRGVGPWTVEMMLIFKLGRPDVLSTTDYGVRKGFAQLYRKRELPKPRVLAEFGEAWAPYRSLASLTMWHAVDVGNTTT